MKIKRTLYKTKIKKYYDHNAMRSKIKLVTTTV